MVDGKCYLSLNAQIFVNINPLPEGFITTIHNTEIGKKQ
jgi:hypothetical protein